MPKKNIEGVWEDVRLWLTDATKTALKEAEDLTRRGRLKMDIIRVSRDIEKGLADLGGRAYKQLSKDPAAPFTADEETHRLLGRIGKLEAEHAALQKEYEAEKRK